MSASAVVMMILAILMLWGGMVAAIVKLRGHPDEPEPANPDEPEPAKGKGERRTGGAHRRRS